MSFRGFIAAALLLAFSAGIPSARADDPTPVPAPSSVPGPAPLPEATTESEPSGIHTVSAEGGATEQGATGGASYQFEGETIPYARIEVIGGKPYLRVRGQIEAIPFNLVHKEVVRENGEVTFDITLTPVNARAQLTISKEELARSHLFITPQAAAELGFSWGPVWGRVRLKASPTAGVAADADSTTLIFGAQIGADATIAYQFTDQTRLEIQGAYARVIGTGDTKGPVYDAALRALLIHELKTGQQIFGGYVSTYNRTDVLPPANLGNSDDGAIQFHGAGAGVAF